MNRSKYARGVNGAPVNLTHWMWGSRREVSAAAAPTRSSEALTGHTVFIETSAPVHFRMGDAGVTTVPADPILKPGAVYAFPRARGEEFLSVMTIVGGSAAVLQYWEADTFIEA